jgi:Protein of unknown function (DUF3738)
MSTRPAGHAPSAKLALCIAGIFLAQGQTQPQTTPAARDEFEVAAIRPFAPNPNGGYPMGVKGGPGTADPGRIIYTNLSLKDLLMLAYNVKEYQVNSPDWMEESSARFVIGATIHAGATQEQVNRMLQNLLADRFKLTLHRENEGPAASRTDHCQRRPQIEGVNDQRIR